MAVRVVVDRTCEIESAEPEPSEPTEEPEPSEPIEEPEPSEPAATPALPETFTMPDVVGANLQDAQDLLQSLGSYAMDQQDASGLGRVQVLDRNWKVCSQDRRRGRRRP